jgi:DNA replication protein DnaC
MTQQQTKPNQDTPCSICKGARWLVQANGDTADVVPCSCYARELEERRKHRLLAGLNMPERLQGMTFENFHPEWAIPPAIPAGSLKSRDPIVRHQGREAERRKALLAQHYKGNAAAQLQRVYQFCQAYAQNPQGWLVLLGDVGCGKTHLAAAIANYQMSSEKGLTTSFAVVPDLLDHLRATYSPTSQVTYDERFEALCDVSLLILDDLGTQSSTPWANEKLYQICNFRYNHKLPLVITANEVDSLERRIVSRATESKWGTVWEILAGDLRQSLPT